MRRKLNIVISFSVILLFIAIFNVLYATNVPEVPVVQVVPEPEPSPENPVASLNVVSFNVKTDKPSYSPGETVQIQIYMSIKNVGEKSITMGGLDFGYIVYDSSKREMHGGIGVDVTLVPTTILSQKEFGIRDVLRWNTSNVAPGIYTIKVIFFAPVKAVAEVEVEIKK